METKTETNLLSAYSAEKLKHAEQKEQNILNSAVKKAEARHKKFQKMLAEMKKLLKIR